MVVSFCPIALSRLDNDVREEGVRDLPARLVVPGDGTVRALGEDTIEAVSTVGDGGEGPLPGKETRGHGVTNGQRTCTVYEYTRAMNGHHLALLVYMF